MDENIADMTGKVVVITGANSGIGFYASQYLAAKGATVVMACRSLDKGKAAAETLRLQVPSAKLEVLRYDQASYAAIRSFLDELKSKYKRIHALVLNAGIFHPDAHAKTAEGSPLTIGTNFLGLYYLLRKGMPFFDQGNPQTRIVFVSSLVARTTNMKDFSFLTEEKGGAYHQYCLSKTSIDKFFSVLANGVNLYDFPERKNICFTLMHPGVTNTNIIHSYPPGFRRAGHFVLSAFTHAPETACLGIVYLAGAPYVYNGSVYAPRGPFEISGLPMKTQLPRHIGRGSGQFIYEVGHLVSRLEKGEDHA